MIKDMNQQNVAFDETYNLLTIILFTFIFWSSSIFILVWLIKRFLDNISLQMNKNYLLLQQELIDNFNENNNKLLHNITNVVKLKDKQVKIKENPQNKYFGVI
eukprot:63628_1